jgi:nucleolar MIF4G domain-containing protein 1
MVETIINLKNNRAKATNSSSVLTSEATIRMKKFLGKLNEKGLRSGGEPLRVTLEDIRNVKEKGKWWLVGASWKNDDISFEPVKSNNREEQDVLLSLAREQRMNTEIRRAVFIALMGSEVPPHTFALNLISGLYGCVDTDITPSIEKNATE